MDSERKFFQVLTEDGELKEAELLNIITKNDIDYAVYSISKDDDTSDLFASRIIIGENGQSTLVDIEDKAEKEEIIKTIREMLQN